MVVDAYHGTVDFYVVIGRPNHSNLAKGLSRMFKAFTTMPEALQQHIRYPEALFTVQQDMLLSYHLTDAKAFMKKKILEFTHAESRPPGRDAGTLLCHPGFTWGRRKSFC